MEKGSYIGCLLVLYVVMSDVGIVYATSFSNFDLETNWDTYLCANGNPIVDEKTVILVASGLTSGALPCLAMRKNLKISGRYQISSQLINVAPPIGQRNFGLVFNAKDENNYELAYLRYIDGQKCTAVVHGYVDKGNVPVELATSGCLKIQTNSWNSLRLTVNEKSPADPNLKNINAYIDEKLVGSFIGKFVTRGFGGVLAENGFNNVAEFRNFDIAPIIPNLSEDVEKIFCVQVVTGSGKQDTGTLEFFVDNVLQSPSKKFKLNEIVLDECFTNLDKIKVKNPSKDAWIGNIVVTENGLEKELECINCCGPDFNGKILVDGDGACGSFAGAQCLGGISCTLKIKV